MQKHMPQLLSAMTPFPYHIDAKQNLDAALELMRLHNIRHIPVMVDGTIETIVSDRDINHAQTIGHRGTPDDELRIGDICPASAHFADVYDPLDQVLEVMIARNMDAIIVLREGAPAGIFTDTDACRTLVQLLRELHPPADDDKVA